MTASQFSQRWDNRRRSLGGPHVRRRGLRARIGAQRLLLTPPPLVPLACVKLVPAVAFNLLFGQLERRRTYPSNEVLLDPTHVTRWIALPARRTGDRNGHGSPAVANATHDFVGAHANGRRVLRHAVRGEVPGRVVGWHPTPLCTLEADALTLFDRRRPVRATALRCGRLWMGRIEVAGRSCVGALAPPRRPLVRDTVPRGVTHDLPRLRDQLRRPSAVFFVVHRPLRCTRRLSGDADANRKSGSAPTCPATFGPEVILVPRPPGGTPITRSCHAHGWPLRSAHGHAQDRPLSSQGLARTDGVRALPFPPPRAALRLAPRVLPRIHGKPSPAPGRTRTLRGRSLSATPSRSPWPGALRRAGGTTSAPGRRSRAAASRGRTSRLSAPPIPGSTWSPPRVGDEGA